MGNRAVITHSTNSKAPAIYLHWNGGRASVEAFMAIAKLLKLKTNKSGFDKLAEILAADFFETKVGMTVYRMPYGQTDQDNWDNGVYVVSADWDIIDRKHLPDNFNEEIDAQKTAEITVGILSSRIEHLESKLAA